MQTREYLFLPMTKQKKNNGIHFIGFLATNGKRKQNRYAYFPTFQLQTKNKEMSLFFNYFLPMNDKKTKY